MIIEDLEDLKKRIKSLEADNKMLHLEIRSLKDMVENILNFSPFDESRAYSGISKSSASWKTPHQPPKK